MDSSSDLAVQVTTTRIKSICEIMNQEIIIRRPMDSAVTMKPVIWKMTLQSWQLVRAIWIVNGTNPGKAAIHILNIKIFPSPVGRGAA